MGDPCPHLEVERTKVKVKWSQVKTASVSKRGPRVLAFEATQQSESGKYVTTRGGQRHMVAAPLKTEQLVIPCP